MLPLNTKVDMVPSHIRPVASPSNDEDYSIRHIYAVDTYPPCSAGGAFALPTYQSVEVPGPFVFSRPALSPHRVWNRLSALPSWLPTRAQDLPDGLDA